MMRLLREERKRKQFLNSPSKRADRLGDPQGLRDSRRKAHEAACETFQWPDVRTVKASIASSSLKLSTVRKASTSARTASEW